VLAVYARALLDAGLPDRAEAVASAALARRVTAAALTVRGRARAAQSRFGLAKEDLQGASELEPLDPEAYEGMERVLEATGEIDAVSAWRDRADAARARGEELARLRRDLGAAPFDARAGEALAEALVAAGLTAEAALVIHRIRTPELDPCRAW
jgi:tetratricopeptide (TPR) repeat protein